MSKFFIPYVRHNDIPCVRHNLLEKHAIKSQKSLIYMC
jgi:hypothetical protein